MRFEGIAFPRALIEAQERGELAIFAGAGVSMPAPSSLPDFNSLAIELAICTETRQVGEAADRFLGKLSPNLNIHERTQRRLGSPDSRPNSMHHDLLKLFSASSAVRLVTTNFDDHFASAATEVFVGESPEMFFAPALPVGSDFVGIVHLHGSVRQDPRRIVLTDRDFGRAYLTEGWARRFVLELFLKYTVLFVGYSHNDPVMQYLARGLPPGDLSKRRYAFGVNNSKASWDNLGIQLQVYSERNEINRHVQLQIACSKWAQRVRETPLESREQIRQIVEKPPQPAGDEIDLIEKAIEDRVLLQFFTEFASTSEWLNWTSGREAFRRILNSNSPSTNGDRQLALWFAQKFAIQHAGVALDLIRRNGSFVPPLLWESIAWVVWQSSKEENDSVALNAWLPVLVTNQPPYGHNFLEYILAACRLPKDDTAALLLIRHLLKPSFTLREGFVRKAVQETDEPAVGMELTIRGNPTFVDQGWQHFKEAGIGPYADRFLSVVVFHLEEATELFRLYGTEFTGWDPISVNLSTLDSPSITLSHNGLSLLVDIARETLKWIIENEPDRGIEVIRSWATAQSLTLRRLAAHGVALTSHWSADDKLSWLKDRLGLFEPGLSPETRRILDAAFADASQSSRDAIVKAVAEGPKHRAGQERQRDVRSAAVVGDARHQPALQEPLTIRPDAGQRRQPRIRRVEPLAREQVTRLCFHLDPAARVGVIARHGQRRERLARFQIAHHRVPRDPVEGRVISERRAVGVGEAFDAGKPREQQREIGAQQIAPFAVRRARVIERGVLKILQVEPQVIRAFGERAFHALEQLMPVLLQHEAAQLLAQLGARRGQTRTRLGVGGRQLVDRVPTHAADQASRRQIAALLRAQVVRHRAGLFEEVACRCDRGMAALGGLERRWGRRRVSGRWLH